MATELTVTCDHAEWKAWLRSIPHDLRHTPEFVSIATIIDPGTPGCARYVGDSGVVLYPFIRRQLPNGASDLTTASPMS